MVQPETDDKAPNGKMIVKALRAGLKSRSGQMWPPGLRLPTSALDCKDLSSGLWVQR